MRIIRFKKDKQTYYGKLDGSRVKLLESSPEQQEISITETDFALDNIEILPPVSPPNIIAIGLNYEQHARESGSDIPSKPEMFIKATSSIIGPEENIILPKMAPDKVDYEAELAVVIGKKAKNITTEEASDYILGYTCANDVSARDCQRELDAQWARAKSFDTFCPVGPWLETELEPNSLAIKSRLNGVIMQDSNTSDMIFEPLELVSYISKNMTLYPGTLILTGTPEGVGFAREPSVYLESGDHIEIIIEGIGTLSNQVIKEE